MLKKAAVTVHLAGGCVMGVCVALLLREEGPLLLALLLPYMLFLTLLYHEKLSGLPLQRKMLFSALSACLALAASLLFRFDWLIAALAALLAVFSLLEWRLGLFSRWNEQIRAKREKRAR